MSFLEIFIVIFLLICWIIFGFILFENEYRCSYCGKFLFGKNSWYRKGPYLHPDNIVNECKNCNAKQKL